MPKVILLRESYLANTGGTYFRFGLLALMFFISFNYMPLVTNDASGFRFIIIKAITKAEGGRINFFNIINTGTIRIRNPTSTEGYFSEAIVFF